MIETRRRSAAVLALLAVVAFTPALRAGFLWDDVTIYLLENPLVRAADGLWRFWFTRQATDYYPLTNSLFWFEWHLFGAQAFGYHAVQIGLHAMATLLVWRVLVALRIRAAWLAAAIFGVHPLGVETVAWISQTKNTLSLGLAAASVLVFLRFDTTHRRRDYGIAMALVLLAILAKTQAAVLPAVLLGSLWWRRRCLTLADVRAVLPAAAMAIVFGCIAVSFQARTSGAAEAAALPFATRLVAAGWIPWFYLWKMFVPTGLALVYPQWNVDARAPLAWLPGLAWVGLFAAAWRQRTGVGAGILAGLGYYMIALVPVLGFVGVGFMAHTRVTDHWSYSALPGPVTLVVAAAARWTASRHSPPRLGATLAVLCLGVLVALSWRQSSLYIDEEELWRDTLRKNPRAWVAHNNLGRSLVLQARLADAEAEFRAAVALSPRYGDALLNLANVVDDQGRTSEALSYYRRALEVNSERADLYFNYGMALEKAGRPAEAAAAYERATILAPLDVEASARLAAVRRRLSTSP